MDQFIYITGQVLGVVAILLGFASYQTRTQKGLLLLQLATTVVFSIHYLMIGAVTAMAMNAIGVVRNTVYYFRNKNKSDSLLFPMIFAVIMAAVGVFTWEAWYSVFVFAGLVINTLCLAFKDPQNVRKSILVTSPMVLIYDVFALSLGGIVYESVAIASSVIGIIRHPRPKTSSCEKESAQA